MNGVFAVEGNWFFLSGGQVLQISRVQKEDAGKYTCQAVNEAGEDHMHFELEVLGEQQSTYLLIIKVKTTEGESSHILTFFCHCLVIMTYYFMILTCHENVFFMISYQVIISIHQTLLLSWTNNHHHYDCCWFSPSS